MAVILIDGKVAVVIQNTSYALNTQYLHWLYRNCGMPDADTSWELKQHRSDVLNYTTNYVICFNKEEDATAFSLRFGL